MSTLDKITISFYPIDVCNESRYDIKQVIEENLKEKGIVLKSIVFHECEKE